MEPFKIIRQDIPDAVTKRINKVFDGEWYRDHGFYGPEKYCFRDTNNRELISTVIPHIKLRDDDVWIGGFPRSGTNWLSEMIWLLHNNLDFEKARSSLHYSRVKLFELPYLLDDYKKDPDLEVYDNMQSRRFFKSHYPLSLLPPKLLDTSKMVYVTRDPRDTFLSYYKLLTKVEASSLRSTKEEAFELFLDGYLEYCPYFKNILEFWNAREHPNLLFLFYEDMIKDLPAIVRQVASFYNKTLSESEMGKLCEHLQFKNMKVNKSFQAKLDNTNIEFVCQGITGGWREEFNEDMKNRAQKWIEDNLKDTDFPYKLKYNMD